MGGGIVEILFASNNDVVHVEKVGVNKTYSIDMYQLLLTIGGEPVNVQYDTAPMSSIDQSPISVASTGTRAVWFETPDRRYVVAEKTTYTIPVELERQSVNISFTVLSPNYYVQTERQAEIVARILLGDTGSCLSSNDNPARFVGCEPSFLFPVQSGDAAPGSVLGPVQPGAPTVFVRQGFPMTNMVSEGQICIDVFNLRGCVRSRDIADKDGNWQGVPDPWRGMLIPAT